MSRSYKKHPVPSININKALKRLSARQVRYSDDPIDARAKVDSWDIRDYTFVPVGFKQYLNKRLSDFKRMEVRQIEFCDRLYVKLLNDKSLSVTEEIWKEWNKYRKRK